MPKLTQLPDGRWVYAPDIDPYIEQLRSRPSPEENIARLSEVFGQDSEDEDEDEGTLAGSAWEGIKSIPSGVADVFLSGAQAAIGVATPFADLPVERRLREQSSKRARERDPAYRDAFLPAVGTGLGQVAGLSAISRLPYGWAAAMGAGVGMGISEQTRRIADYEQRTGTDVPWYKESSAHMMGALIGLSEVLPIKFGLFPASVSKMMGRMKAGVDPNSLGYMSKLENTFGIKGAMVMGLQEATQEASAQWLQAMSARGLYDPNAMEDIAHSMAEDFKVGGVVGGIAKLVTHQIIRGKIRGSSPEDIMEREFQRGIRRDDKRTRSVHGNITGISEELSATLGELGIEGQLARDMNEHMGGVDSALPFGVERMLSSGQISRSEIEQLVKEFQVRNAGAKTQLDELIKYHSDPVRIDRAASNAKVQQYVQAKIAIDKMSAARIAALREDAVGLHNGSGEMGGLSGDPQYQSVRQAEMDAAEGDQAELSYINSLRRDRREGAEKPSYRTKIRDLMGGAYRVGGLFRMAELLGVRRGPGSEKINFEIQSEGQTFPQADLASSDRSSFDMAELGSILFTPRGRHIKKSKEAGRNVDVSDVMDDLLFPDSVRQAPGGPRVEVKATLKKLAAREEALKEAAAKLYAGRAFTRELSEVQREKKYDSEADWIRERDDVQSVASLQGQSINAELAKIKREQSIIYSRLLNERLRTASLYFEGNPDAKQKAAERVFGDPDTERFDAWLNGTIATVTTSEYNGNAEAKKAEEARLKFESDMLNLEAPDADKEALEAKYLTENVNRFIELPRDISAPQLMRIADLFIEGSGPKDGAEDALIYRAYADISNWKVEDELYEVTPSGIPDLNPTKKVLQEFEDKLVRFSTITTGKSGEVSTRRGKKEDISADDIVELLGSKNIHLRNGKRIGDELAERTGVGVESGPFRKLLEDLTGAPNWEEATYPQRLLMYSRLLQLPAHYKSRGSPDELAYLKEIGADDYRPLFLPDFHHDPSIDAHVDFITDEVIEVTGEGYQAFPSLEINALRDKTSEELGDGFDSESFDEAMARLIEAGAFNATAESAPDEDAEYLIAEREGLQAEEDIAPPASPRTGGGQTTRVRFDREAELLHDAISVGEASVREPGDARSRDREYWVRESDPELVRRDLKDRDAAWADQIDDMLINYNERNPKGRLTRDQYIDQYTALVTSSVAPLQELSNLGILGTVEGRVMVPGKLAPTESILDLGTAGGRSLIQSLMKSGGLPSSLQDNVQSLRRRFTDTMKTRFEALDKNIRDLVTTMKLPDGIERLYVDDADGLFQFLSDVTIRGEDMSADLVAMYDRPGNRIIINLAAIDPNDMRSAQEIVRDAAFEEGLHALLIRHHLTLEEKEILYNFVRNQENIVPKEIDPSAYSAKLTWFERAVVEASSTGRGMKLPEADIENEAVIALLGNLVRHPDIYVDQTKLRKVGKGIRGFLEGFVDAAKDADIVDVLKILGRIESGAVGDRGAGFLGEGPYTTTSIIRSNDLFRYANPQDIEQLRAAVILQEAAPSEQMRASEQAKIDDIVDKIVANQDAIQGSAQPAPNAEQAIEDERQKIQHMRDTHAGQMPLIGLDQSKKNSEAYKIAINTFMEMRGQDPKYAYKMPEPYQTFMNNRSTITPKLQNIVDGLVADGTIAPPDKNAARKRFEKEGVLSGNNFYAGAEHVLAGQIESKELEISSGEMSPERAEKAKAELKTLKDELRELASKRAKEATGDTIEGTRENFKKTADELRYNYLDRRQWVVKQTDRIMAAQNRAQLDAETSALVMWRNSDNALNWLPSLMLRGPLSYLGVSVERGKFENAPAYDRGLREKHGGDGRIQGLNDILEPIIDEADQSGALAYGLAKRILWTKSRRDSFVRAVGDPGKIPLAPEVRRKLELFEEAYEDINPGEKLTEDRLNEIVREVEGSEGNKEIVEFWDRYNAYDNHMINLAYDTGMITREQRDEWMSMPYAPFYRDTAEVSDFPIGSHGEIQKRGINMVEKSLRASMEPLKNDLAGSIIENTQALVRDSMMNVAVARTVRDALALGEARKISISSLAGSVNNRVVRVMEKGVPVFYELSDPQLAMSSMMLGHNPKRQLQKLFGEHKVGTLAQRALTGASSLLRESVTRTLAFAQKNVFRDSWTAMNLTGGGPLLVLEAFKNAFSVDSLRRADELGLSIGIDFIADPGEYGNKMRSELKKANLDWKNPFNGLSTFWNFTGRISKQSEVATRLAVYDRILALTGDKALAAHYAIEIMNYGRRGASPVLSTFMSTVPFMNGRLEGLDVTYRGLRAKKGSSDIPGIHGYGLTADQYDGLPWWKKSRGQILGRGALLTAATGALYMLMRDDEEWQDLREEVKADNWVLPLSDHAWLKIPIPFEIGVIFKVIPEKIFEAVIEKDVDAADVGEETWRQIRSTLSLVGYPQLFAPVIGAMRNYDVFRKDAIVDHWMEETLSPNEQRSLYTSNVARGIADLANSVPLVRNLDFLTSPMKVEYMVRQYVGTTGGYVVTMADRLARTGILPDLPFDPYMNLARAESVVGTNKDFDFKSMIGGEGVANVPILGDLLTDPRTRSGRQQQFFQMITELDTILATLRSITERDRKKGFGYAEKHRNVLRHQNQLRFVQGQLRDWRERRGHLEKISSQAMSMDDKRAYYQRLLRSRADILAGVDRIMSSIKQG